MTIRSKGRRVSPCPALTTKCKLCKPIIAELCHWIKPQFYWLLKSARNLSSKYKLVLLFHKLNIFTVIITKLSCHAYIFIMFSFSSFFKYLDCFNNAFCNVKVSKLKVPRSEGNELTSKVLTGVSSWAEVLSTTTSAPSSVRWKQPSRSQLRSAPHRQNT